MQPRSFYLGFALVACVLVLIALVPTTRHDVALLEQLTPRIERAQTLAPETRDTIVQLVTRVRESAGDPREFVRRELAVRRATDALNARGGLTSVGQSEPEMAPTLTSSP